MHPDRHSPENSPNVEPRRIEQRLRALRPHPTTLDAESVLREARRQERPVPLAAGAARSDQAATTPMPTPPPMPWLALAAAGGCGAIVGAALTCLAMLSFQPLPTGASTTGAGTTGTPSVTASASSPPPTGNANQVQTEGVQTGGVQTGGGLPAPGDSQVAPDRIGIASAEKRLAVNENVSDDSPRASIPVSAWSLSESLNSTPWLDLRGPQVPGERLVAGNHLPLQSRRSSSSPSDHPNLTAPAASLMDRGEPLGAAPTPLTLDPDSLLHELLGTPTGSTL